MDLVCSECYCFSTSAIDASGFSCARRKFIGGLDDVPVEVLLGYPKILLGFDSYSGSRGHIFGDWS